MRVEDSAIMAKALGFEYRYPLLYPKLVEFCYRLPLEQKRKNGINRLLVRKYLAQYLPDLVYNKHQKIGSIMPATMDKVKREYLKGKYSKEFSNLPYEKQMEWISKAYHSFAWRKSTSQTLLYGIKAYLMKNS
jgi:asparagine synthetase B (glutamine-hydrolysing)